MKGSTIQDAIIDRIKLKSFDNYIAHGISIEQVPETELPEDYSGKIVLVECKDRLFLRGINGSGSMHSEAYDGFCNELELRGFRTHARVRGGAYLSQDKDGRIIVSGDSGDYGECDKTKAKEMLERYYPGKTVIAKRSEGDGW